MSAIFAIFLAKFITPIPIAVGIAGAFFSRSWSHVPITALVAAAIGEIFLRVANPDHSFSPLAFLIGVVAAGIWAAWFYWIRLAKLKNK